MVSTNRMLGQKSLKKLQFDEVASQSCSARPRRLELSFEDFLDLPPVDGVSVVAMHRDFFCVVMSSPLEGSFLNSFLFFQFDQFLSKVEFTSPEAAALECASFCRKDNKMNIWLNGTKFEVSFKMNVPQIVKCS